MGKFSSLVDYCRNQKFREFELPFHKTEAIIGSKLPASAGRSQYWANVANCAGPVRLAKKDTPYATFFVAGSKRVRLEQRYERQSL